MAEEIEFGQRLNNTPTRKQRGVILYTPRQDQSMTVRFVGVQQKIYQYWNSQTKKFSCSVSPREDYTLRIVSFVIDRVDNAVKAFICPSSVFEQLGQLGGSDHDFKISRTGSGLRTRYDVESLGKTEVSQDLLDRVEITSNVYSLSDIFVKNVKWELLDKEHEPIQDRFEILDL